MHVMFHVLSKPILFKRFLCFAFSSRENLKNLVLDAVNVEVEQNCIYVGCNCSAHYLCIPGKLVHKDYIKVSTIFPLTKFHVLRKGNFNCENCIYSVGSDEFSHI